MTAAPDAAGAVETVQKAAAPVAFIAVVIGAALAVAALVKRLGASLPAPAYAAPYTVPDFSDVQDDDDEEEVPRDQWS